MGTKVITNKDGKMETIQDSSDEVMKRKLHDTRKALRDMLDGNTQFHEDKLGPDKKPKEEVSGNTLPDIDFNNFYGMGNLNES